MIKETHMVLRRVTVFGAFLFAGLVWSSGNAQQVSGPVKAVQLIGLTGVKQDAKGTLHVENGNLHFVHSKATSDVSASSIQDVVTGADTEKAVGKTVGMVSMAAPYGGGRFLSLFRKKIDTLTIQYRDVDGGLHGAIFTMPVGNSELIKTELLAQGAHAVEPSVVPASGNSPVKEEKPALSQGRQSAKIKASA